LSRIWYYCILIPRHSDRHHRHCVGAVMLMVGVLCGSILVVTLAYLLLGLHTEYIIVEK